MQLLTAELRAQLPPLYSQEKNEDPIIHLKFFCPWSNWTWFATEGKQDDDEFLFFGNVIGFEEEWGYFALSELNAARGPGGLTIERDLYFKPGPFSQVIEQFRRERGLAVRRAGTPLLFFLQKKRMDPNWFIRQARLQSLIQGGLRNLPNLCH